MTFALICYSNLRSADNLGEAAAPYNLHAWPLSRTVFGCHTAPVVLLHANTVSAEIEGMSNEAATYHNRISGRGDLRPWKGFLPLIMGFGIHWLWVYLFLFNGLSLFYPQVPTMQTTLFPTSLLIYAVALLCYGVFLEPMRRRFSTAQKRSRNRLTAALCVFASMLLALFANAFPTTSLACGIASGALSGFGSAVLLMSYGVSFSVCDLPTTAICTAVSLLIGAVCYACVYLLDAILHPLGMLICLALPFVEVVCLRGCSHQLVDNLEFTFITNPVHPKPFSFAMCLPSLVFGFALGFIRTRAILSLTNSEDLETTALAIVAAGVLASILLILGMLMQRKANHFAFRVLMPIASLLIASLSIPGFDEGIYPAFALFCSYLMLEACLWIMCADISQRFRISAFFVFGFGRGTLAVGTLISYFAALPGYAFETAMTDVNVLIAVLFVSVVVGLETLPSNTQIRRTLKRGRYCPAFVSPEEYEDEGIITANDPLAAASKTFPTGTTSTLEKITGTDSIPSATETPTTGRETGDAANKPRANNAGNASRAVRTHESTHTKRSVNKDDREAGGIPRGTSTGIPEGAEIPAGTETPAEMRNLGEGNLLDGTSRLKTPAKASSAHEMGRFKRKCASVAERYLLSSKETEVLFLLAKGYKSSTIQERLYISEGTANTHMRHIYRKLDVHSQLELMNLIEAEKIEIE